MRISRFKVDMWGMLNRVLVVLEYRIKHMVHLEKYNRSKQLILRYTEAWIDPTTKDWLPDDV